MGILSGTYLVGIGMAAPIARALSKGLPDAFRVRLEAKAPPCLEPGWVWLHAVSVGELLLAAGLLGKLRDNGYIVHVTTGTQAGLELLEKRLPSWGGGSGRVTGGGFPLDDPGGLKSFFEAPPGIFIALETELWPNLFVELELRNIPACIVNGRLTARTMNSKFRPWLRCAASHLSLVAARDQASADNFRLLGATNVALGGNLKADVPPPPPLHNGWEALRAGWQGEAILVAGNTVEGEEELILNAWRLAKKERPGLRLILAPRQPRRFDAVAGLLGEAGLPFRRAADAWPTEAAQWRSAQVLLLDTIGELASVYGLGALALIGGGWRWHGGHNPMEPLHWGLPTIIGPSCTNFEDLVGPLSEAGCLEVASEGEIGNAVCRLLPRAGQNAAPVKIPERLQGCLQRTWGFLVPYLPELR